MREIKFRGKSIKTGEWLHGDLIHNHDKVYIAPIGKIYIDFSAEDFEVDENTIYQYTGKKDEHNAEIYEGDVIKLNNDNSYTYTVEWSDNHSAFLANCIETKLDVSDFNHRAIIEVIGNIYDNPELIGKED